jgi:hypothetical protein
VLSSSGDQGLFIPILRDTTKRRHTKLVIDWSSYYVMLLMLGLLNVYLSNIFKADAKQCVNNDPNQFRV